MENPELFVLVSCAFRLLSQSRIDIKPEMFVLVLCLQRLSTQYNLHDLAWPNDGAQNRQTRPCLLLSTVECILATRTPVSELRDHLSWTVLNSRLPVSDEPVPVY